METNKLGNMSINDNVVTSLACLSGYAKIDQESENIISSYNEFTARSTFFELDGGPQIGLNVDRNIDVRIGGKNYIMPDTDYGPGRGILSNELSVVRGEDENQLTAELIATRGWPNLVTKANGGSITADVGIVQHNLSVLSGNFSGGIGAVAAGANSFAYGTGVSAIGENSYAIGKDSIAGCYGWYYKYLDLATGTFYLTTEQPDVRAISAMGEEPEIDTSFDSGFAAGDVISYVNKNKRDLYATVTKVNGNKIVVGQLNDSVYTIDEEHPNHDDWTIFVPEKSAVGQIWLGECAFAEGKESKAINAYSHAEGGKGCLAYGQYGHAEGKNTRAGYAAHSEGAQTQVIGQYSHAEGGEFNDTVNNVKYPTIASGKRSHAEGEGNIAAGMASHAEGRMTLAAADISHTEGNKTTASGNNSHAEGYQTLASGAASHSEGVNTTAGAEDTPKTASTDTADGKFTHAEGNGTLAYGNSSHAEGKSTVSNGRNSHAEGANTQTKGVASHAEGYQTRTLNRNEHAEGSFNKSNKANDVYGNVGNTLHSIGMGTSESNRKNAVEVMQNGDIYILGIGGYDGTNFSTAQSLQSVIATLQAAIQ